MFYYNSNRYLVRIYALDLLCCQPQLVRGALGKGDKRDTEGYEYNSTSAWLWGTQRVKKSKFQPGPLGLVFVVARPPHRCNAELDNSIQVKYFTGTAHVPLYNHHGR